MQAGARSRRRACAGSSVERAGSRLQWRLLYTSDKAAGLSSTGARLENLGVLLHEGPLVVRPSCTCDEVAGSSSSHSLHTAAPLCLNPPLVARRACTCDEAGVVIVSTQSVRWHSCLKPRSLPLVYLRRGGRVVIATLSLPPNTENRVQLRLDSLLENLGVLVPAVQPPGSLPRSYLRRGGGGRHRHTVWRTAEHRVHTAASHRPFQRVSVLGPVANGRRESIFKIRQNETTFRRRRSGVHVRTLLQSRGIENRNSANMLV